MIYFIKVGNRCKFGFANNVKERLKTLQTGCPQIIQIVATCEGSLLQEKQLHYLLQNRFDTLHLQGEWYRWNHPAISQIVEAFVTKTLRVWMNDASNNIICKPERLVPAVRSRTGLQRKQKTPLPLYFDERVMTKRDFERWVTREMGYSRSQAHAMINVLGMQWRR